MQLTMYSTSLRSFLPPSPFFFFSYLRRFFTTDLPTSIQKDWHLFLIFNLSILDRGKGREWIVILRAREKNRAAISISIILPLSLGLLLLLFAFSEKGGGGRNFYVGLFLSQYLGEFNSLLTRRRFLFTGIANV